MNTHQLAEQYFQKWTTDCDRARPLMADDLTFEGSLNRYTSADALIGPIKKFSSLMKSVKLLKLATQGDEAFLLYDCEMPFGTLRTAEWQRFENGKLKATTLVYDPSELKKLMAR